MTNREKKIVSLLEEGFSYDTIKKMSDTHINMLYNRLVKEMVVRVPAEKLKDVVKNDLPDGSTIEVTEDDDLDNSVEKESGYDPYAGNSVGNDDGPSDNMNANDGMNEDFFGDINEDEVLEALFGKPKKKMKTPITTLGMFEGEVDEKFESKSQQRLFYAKCEEEGPKSKWCKMAKEFSDDTKDFKSLPEKVSKEEKIRQIEESIVSLIKKTQGKVITKKDILSEEPKIAPAQPKVDPGTKPERFSPYRTKPGSNPKPKAGTEVKPAQPKVDPGTKPERFSPYRTKPGSNPKPKAGDEGGLPEFLKFNNLNIKFRDE